MLLFFFFFSSRRRHTRFDCDWSSDVCSSDLAFFGSADGQVRFLGTAAGGLASTRPVLEVWLARRGAGGRDPGDTGRVRWLPFDELLAAAGSPALRDPRTLAALALAARSDILAEWRRPSEPEREAAPRQVGERRVRLSDFARSEEHTSELQSQSNLVCRLLLEKKKT